MNTEAIAAFISSLVDSAKKILEFLTLGRLGMLVCLIIIGMVTLVVYENRQPITNWALTSGEKYSSYDSIPPLSDPTVNLIKTIVQRQGNLIGVQVVQMDFRNNTRDTSFFYSKRQQLQREFDDYMSTKVSSPTLFATADMEQNDRLIRIMEQEFVCVATPPNIIEMLPSASKEVQQVCSISVPPRFGKMVGYVNILLSQPMTPTMVQNYKSVARQISDEIYDRDVMKTKT